MSGHSKWANIKHRKAAQDAKKGKIFTRFGKELTIAAKHGGSDLESNFRLRTIVDKARAANMPIENITRAIKRGTGELPGANYEEQHYEGYAPDGVAVVIECLTDNKNRTVADIRRTFSANGGTLAETGAVGWMFEKKGVIRVDAQGKTEDELIEKLLDYDVDDVNVSDNLATITVSPKNLEPVKQALQTAGYKIEAAEVEWVANNTVSLPDDKAEKVIAFLERIEELDDVQNIYSNLA